MLLCNFNHMKVLEMPLRAIAKNKPPPPHLGHHSSRAAKSVERFNLGPLDHAMRQRAPSIDPVGGHHRTQRLIEQQRRSGHHAHHEGTDAKATERPGCSDCQWGADEGNRPHDCESPGPTRAVKRDRVGLVAIGPLGRILRHRKHYLDIDEATSTRLSPGPSGK